MPAILFPVVLKTLTQAPEIEKENVSTSGMLSCTFFLVQVS